MPRTQQIDDGRDCTVSKWLPLELLIHVKLNRLATDAGYPHVDYKRSDCVVEAPNNNIVDFSKPASDERIVEPEAVSDQIASIAALNFSLWFLQEVTVVKGHALRFNLCEIHS
jgi:hypothetical protein